MLSTAAFRRFSEGHLMNFMENHPICRVRAQIVDICQTFLLYKCFLEGLLYVKITSLARLQCPTGGLRWRSLLPPPDATSYMAEESARPPQRMLLLDICK